MISRAVISEFEGLQLEPWDCKLLEKYEQRNRVILLSARELMSKWGELSIWDNTYLFNYGEKLQGRFRKGLKELSRVAFPHERPSSFGFGSPGIFGPDVAAHAFYHRDCQRGFRLLEPQVTKVLKYFLDPATTRTTAGSIRSRSFVTALLRSTNQCDDIDEFCLDSMNGTLKVSAEENDLDLLLEWGLPGARRLVAVEIKLGHHVTRGQLAKYRKAVKKRVPQKKNRRLFVLARDFNGKNATALKINNEWIAVTWWGLLRHWEKVLSESGFNDQDKDFPRFRRAMWALGVLGK